MRRNLAGFGVFLLFVAPFLTWLYGPSQFTGHQTINLFTIYTFLTNDVFGGVMQYQAAQDSFFTLAVLFYPMGFIGALLVLGGWRVSIAYPGLLSLLSVGFWLYDVSSQGYSVDPRLVLGPYIASVGALFVMVSAASLRRRYHGSSWGR